MRGLKLEQVQSHLFCSVQLDYLVTRNTTPPTYLPHLVTLFLFYRAGPFNVRPLSRVWCRSKTPRPTCKLQHTAIVQSAFAFASASASASAPASAQTTLSRCVRLRSLSFNQSLQSFLLHCRSPHAVPHRIPSLSSRPVVPGPS